MNIFFSQIILAKTLFSETSTPTIPDNGASTVSTIVRTKLKIK